MANTYKNNPVILDTVSATVDLALQITELSTAPVFVQKVVLSTTASSDIIILKDRRSAVKAELASFAAGQTEMDFDPPLHCDGLQIVAGDNTLTSTSVSAAQVFIYI